MQHRSFWYQSVQTPPFCVVAIEFFLAAVHKGSTLAKIHRGSVMIYGSLQAEFMETKYNGHIHRYGTYTFGKIVVYVFKPIDNNNQILWGM